MTALPVEVDECPGERPFAENSARMLPDGCTHLRQSHARGNAKRVASREQEAARVSALCAERGALGEPRLSGVAIPESRIVDSLSCAPVRRERPDSSSSSEHLGDNAAQPETQDEACRSITTS